MRTSGRRALRDCQSQKGPSGHRGDEDARRSRPGRISPRVGGLVSADVGATASGPRLAARRAGCDGRCLQPRNGGRSRGSPLDEDESSSCADPLVRAKLDRAGFRKGRRLSARTILEGGRCDPRLPRRSAGPVRCFASGAQRTLTTRGSSPGSRPDVAGGVSRGLCRHGVGGVLLFGSQTSRHPRPCRVMDLGGRGAAATDVRSWEKRPRGGKNCHRCVRTAGRPPYRHTGTWFEVLNWKQKATDNARDCGDECPGGTGLRVR